jgi:hypothetical protein
MVQARQAVTRRALVCLVLVPATLLAAETRPAAQTAREPESPLTGALPFPPEPAPPRKPVPGSIYGRTGTIREKALREGGGTTASEAAVALGLEWLAKQQSPDGRWRLDGDFNDRGTANDVAGTALGLLPFLGAGKTHSERPYDKVVEKGLLFLLRKQDRQTGAIGGGMYTHALATIALAEDYGMTSYPSLGRYVQRAVDYIVKAQHKGGGWRYAPGQAGDTSVTGWVVQALVTAKMAGLEVFRVRTTE